MAEPRVISKVERDILEQFELGHALPFQHGKIKAVPRHRQSIILHKLVARGLLLQRGHTRASVYRLTEDGARKIEQNKNSA